MNNNNKVLKFKLDPENFDSIVKMHEGSRVLSVGVQFNEIFVWAFCDLEKEKETRVFSLFPTDQKFNDDNQAIEFVNNYLGTVHINNSANIFHVYEKREVNSVNEAVEKIKKK